MATETVVDYLVETKEDEYEVYYCDHCGKNLGRTDEVAPLIVAINPRWSADVPAMAKWRSEIAKAVYQWTQSKSRTYRLDIETLKKALLDVEMPDVREQIRTDRHEEWCDECIESQFEVEASAYERVPGLSDTYVEPKKSETVPLAAHFGTWLAGLTVLTALFGYFGHLGFSWLATVGGFLILVFAVLTLAAALFDWEMEKP